MLDQLRTEGFVPDTSIFKFSEQPRKKDEEDGTEPLCITDEKKSRIEKVEVENELILQRA